MLLVVPTDRFKSRMNIEEKALCKMQPLKAFDHWKNMITELLPAKEKKQDSQSIIKFSGIALHRISSLLELMISLASEATEGVQILTDLS